MIYMEYDFYPPRDVFSVPKAENTQLIIHVDKNIIYQKSFVHHIFALTFHGNNEFYTAI